MIFAALPLAQAAGAVAAHTHRLAGMVIRKGTVLGEPELAALAQAGRSEIVAVRLEPDDVAEDAAASRVGRLLLGTGLLAGRAATGRLNLHAETAGLLLVDAARVDALNAVHESVTVATLPDSTPVAALDMVATVKVIPFAVPKNVLERVEACAAADPLLSLHPFRAMTAGLVLSLLPGLKPSVLEGTIAATRARIAGLGGTLLPPLQCRHDTGEIADRLTRLRAAGADLLLVAGASATVDRRDVGPAAVVAAGGAIDHFGMPVDPGNLICVGHLGDAPAVVLPGCARSPRPNGIDRILQRLFARLPVDGPAIARMGVGGLLKDTPARPLPRAKAAAATEPVPEPSAPVAAVVLAAGASTRMAPHHKLLLADRSGKPMIARVVDNVLSSRARPVVVVVGHRAAEVREALGGRPVRFVAAADFADGLSASLRAGLAAVPAEAQAALICLGDMPMVTGRILDRLIEAWSPDQGRLIVQPTHRGRAGNPMLWDRRFFAEMAALDGDAGARSLLARHPDIVADVELDDDSVLRDFDTVESLADLPERLRPVAAMPNQAG
jgi:molybdenum cofactor cytidylyltransferase